MKATEHYFPVGLFVMLWMKSESVHIQMKATEQHFPVGLFAVHLGPSFKCVDEILGCRHLKKATEQHSCGAVLSSSTWF